MKIRPSSKPRQHKDEERIYQLWDTLTDLPLAETQQSIEQLFACISEWIGADNAAWIGAVRLQDDEAAKEDLLYGWRLRAAESWRPPTEECQDFIRKVLAHMERDPGMSTRKVVQEAGHFRSYRLRDGFIDFKAFRKTEQYKMYFERGGITDRIWCAFPVNQDAESLFCFDRHQRRNHFAADHEHLVARALRGIKWFHRQLLLNHGLLVGNTPLSPAHRRLLSHLLSGKTEKEIAEALGLTRATTHNYVTEIYRSFNVTSRAALVTLWMGGG